MVKKKSKIADPQKSIHIRIVCPWWGRTEVVKMHCRSMVRFMEESPYTVSYLAIVSLEDKEFKDLRDMAFAFGFDVCSHANYPVSAKLNAGIELALQEGCDYIMNMGSDDLCSPDIWEIYKPFIESNNPFFGIDSCHIVDFYTNEAYYLDLYNNNEPVGVLRMVHVSAIDSLWDNLKLKLYPYGIDRGMDGASMGRLIKNRIYPTVINLEGRVLTTGIKCHTSINHFIHLSMLDMAKPVKYESLQHLVI